MLNMLNVGMKKVLMTDTTNMQKFLVIDKDGNGFSGNNHFAICEKNKRPYIIISKYKTYTHIEIDCITLPRSWDDYIQEHIAIDCTFNLALERMGITKNKLNVSGLGYVCNFEVKNEYAELFAEFLFNYYDIEINRMIHDTNVQLKEKKKDYKYLAVYLKGSESNPEYENEIKKAQECKEEIERLELILKDNA